MTNIDWNKILDSIPPNAPEPIVSSLFVEPLLEALGFSNQERFPGFKTGRGADAVDFAARKNDASNNFLFSPVNPYLLVEVKGRATNAGGTINLLEGSFKYSAGTRKYTQSTPKYIDTREQLKKYLYQVASKGVKLRNPVTNPNRDD